jgi:hypothetical protein
MKTKGAPPSADGIRRHGLSIGRMMHNPQGSGRSDMTGEKDLVLIYFEDKPLAFARIEGIEPDHKPNWYHVRLLLLQTPVQVVTWILRDAYIDGGEFTMNGKRMRLEKVQVPEEAAAPEAPPELKAPARDPAGAKVISLADLKKK